MATNWIKMRAGLDTHICVFQLSEMTNLPVEMVLAKLYRLATWFQLHGKQGAMPENHMRFINTFILHHDGFSEALESVGWLCSEGRQIILTGFCDLGDPEAAEQ